MFGSSPPSDLLQVFRTVWVHYWGLLPGSEPMSRGKPKPGSTSRKEESFEGVGGRRRRYTEEFQAEAVQMLLAVSFFLAHGRLRV